MIIWIWYIGLILINQYEAIFLEKTTNCNPNVYVKPLCLDKITHYNCKCNAGSIWNGKLCVATALNSYFEFTRKSNNHFVLLNEKTFPPLTSFTISTWIRVHDYLTYSKILNSEQVYLNNDDLAKHIKLNNDIRSIFSYSLANYKNAISCQIATSLKSKNKNIKRTKVRLNLTLKILGNLCILDVKHLYLQEQYWFHLTFTWNARDGKVNFYINGKLKAECTNISVNKAIDPAGEFVLGQSYKEPNLNPIRPTQNPFSHPNYYEEEAMNYDLDQSEEMDDQKSSNYDQKYSFVGRIFNFNIWDRAFPAELVPRIYNDDNLIYCGNATQWSDFRQGTRGDVNFKWPTNLLWKNARSSHKYQRKTCNQYCNRIIGPICRENYENNIRWPLIKGNLTSKYECFPNKNKYEFNPGNKKYAYRHCDLKTTYVKRFNRKSKHNRQQSRYPFLGKTRQKSQDYGYAHYNLTTASWAKSNIDECIQEPLLLLRNEVSVFYKQDNFDDMKIFVYIEQLHDLTVQIMVKSSKGQKGIYDLSTIIDTLFYLINAQQQTIKRNLQMDFSYDFEEGLLFSKRSLGIIDILIEKSKDFKLWGFSSPIGSESIRILSLVRELAKCLYDLQRLHFAEKYGFDNSYLKRRALGDKNISQSSAPFELIELKLKNINFRQQFLFSKKQMPLNFKFPSTSDLPQSLLYEQNKQENYEGHSKSYDKGSKKDKEDKTFSSNFYSQINFNNVNLVLPISIQKINSNPYIFDPYALVTVYYNGIESLLPNHNKTFRAKDNNLNSKLITVELLSKDGLIQLDKYNYNSTFDKPITLIYDYMNNFNISDTRCVYLKELNVNNKKYEWRREACILSNKNPSSAVCECSGLGSFSITNDLYDPSWKPKVIENTPLALSSYFGCIIVSLFGIATFACLTYLKTKSVTTLVHKNLCISVCISQLVIIISLSQFDFGENMCQIFGLLNHYMLFVVFAWLMNEAFNLYISITYAAHQSSPVNDNGSQWRTFYLLGWLFPALLIVILFITNSNDYYDKKLCWFNLNHLWINVSPMIAMLCITILVMIISAKEHTEISYTKNEKSNKLISNHTKAVWTQIVLLTLCWTFALMSLVIYGSVIKYLFAFLNCLQGSFLFIFYFVLNEEVRKFWREKKRKNRLKSSTEKGLNLVNLVIGKEEDYDETFDETFETSDKEDYNKLTSNKKEKNGARKSQKERTSQRQTTKLRAGVGKMISNEKIFIEPQEWQKNTERSHNIVDMSAKTQEKITVL